MINTRRLVVSTILATLLAVPAAFAGDSAAPANGQSVSGSQSEGTKPVIEKKVKPIRKNKKEKHVKEVQPSSGGNTKAPEAPQGQTPSPSAPNAQ